MPGGATDPPRRRADSAPRARGPRHAAGRERADRLSRNTAALRSGSVADHVQEDRDRERNPRRRLRGRRRHRRRRVPHRSSGAALHRAERRRRPVAERRHHRLRIDAVSLLRAPRADGAARSARRQGPGGADRDRRRLRRQGRVSVDDRRARGAAGAQGRRTAGEVDLRPRRGHAGDDEAASVDRASSHGRDARRPPHGNGHRGGPRRRRLRHAQCRGPVARLDSRERTVSLRSHPHSRPRDHDQHAAERRVSRLRRAADAVRDRSAHGSHRLGARSRSGALPREERAAPRRHDGHRSASRARLQRAPGAARGGQADELQGGDDRSRPPARASRLRRDKPANRGRSASRSSFTDRGSRAAARSSSRRRRRSR